MIQRTQNTRRTSSARRGVAGIAGMAGAFALTLGSLVASSPAEAAPVLNFDCTATVFGQTVDEGVWTAEVNADVPAQVTVNEAIPAPAVTATVTASQLASDNLRALGVQTIEGTSEAGYTVGGEARTASLTVPQVAIPASGQIVTAASGTGQAETAPAEPGTVTVAVGDFTASLTTDSGFVIPITCTLQAGQDTTIASIAVVAAG